MSLEHGNNFENQSPVVKTGVSEPKEFKKPSDNLNAINQREKIDNLLEKSKLLPAEKEKVIDYILNKYDNNKYESIINQIIDGECETLDDVNSILTLNNNVQEVQSNVEAEKKDLQVYSKIEPLLSGLTGKDSVNLLKLLKDKDFEGVKKALKNSDTFESVVGELEQKDPEKYIQFKETLISIDPSFRESFDKFDSKKTETPKILNLGTPKISPDGKSGETVDGKHNIKIDDKGDRYLLSKDSPYQLKSNLDNKQNIEANQKIDADLENTLKPINEKLNTLSSILDYLENAILKNIDLKDIKEAIKKTDINLYNEYNIENLNSPNDIKNIISQSIKKLEDDKKTAIEKAKNLKRELILKNTKEAAEKDEAVKQLLKFLESIGFTFINQAKLQTILDFININPQTYGLDEKIDLENGVLGFNRDFGDKNINASEKKAFIKLFNRMLGENIIDENISTGITTLSPQAILRIQVLSNKTTGSFMENLGKMEK
ncbi:hypothetical protein HUU51_05015 [Candidatus Gracilibacteria bacterium]|nr:hypothetical protein [Candidatus Gracilibacteria bacterium]